MKLPKQKILELDVAPDQGAAALCAGLNMPGYRFVQMTRKGRKVKIYYEKIPTERNNIRKTKTRK
jgi:hypothetical protein